MKKIGKYEILQELGRGGMGVIYKALDPDINREVAIKVIRNDLISEGPQSEKVLKQFMIEAQAAGRLSHANIATIYEVGRENDQTYIVMQFIPGMSLRKAIEEGQKFSLEQIVDLVAQVCRALDYAHQNGIVHRDIKPDNILLDEAGVPHVVDFGIATIESVNVTRTRTTSATPAYMSPEQVLEETVDPRSDIFSLGVILYEMLTGKRPFAGDNVPSLLNRIVNEEPAEIVPRSGYLPEGFGDIVFKALAKKPEDRWGSAGEMADALIESVRPLERTTVLTRDVRKTVFAGATRKMVRKKKGPAALFATPKGTVIGIAAAASVLFGLIFLGSKLFSPQRQYENLIAIQPFEYETQDIPAFLVEFLLDRSLTASTKIMVLTKDIDSLGGQNGGLKARTPLVRISGRVIPTLTGFEIDLTAYHRSTKKRKVFPCKGTLDLVTTQIDGIASFLRSLAGSDIGPIEGNRTFAQIATSNWDALSHFLKGQSAWEKLEKDTAMNEFKTVLEYDPDFSLARMKAAEVIFFDGRRDDAKAMIQSALDKSDRLIEYDVMRLQALLARIESRPSEERTYLQQLKEAFPLKKEYQYEFAESYFHAGDGAEAITYYQNALNLDPAYSLAHNHIAFCYAWLGQHDKAQEHLVRYVDLDKSPNSYDSMAAGYMFAGRYAKALETLEIGRSLNAKLNYIYSNMASNHQLIGALAKAAEDLRMEADVTTDETTLVGLTFTRAYLRWLKGDVPGAEAELAPALQYYNRPQYADRLDDSPVLPFWLSGILAARRNDAGRLRAVITLLEKRATAKSLNATNYFPILKFLYHLKALEAQLRKDADGVLQAVEESQRIRDKMGYWTSPYNRAFFLDQYAQIIMEMNPGSAMPKELLADVLSYNPSYPPALLRMARILVAEGRKDEARQRFTAAREVLAGADADSLISRELAAVAKLVGA